MSTNQGVGRGDPGYDQLYSVWVAEKRPGYVNLPNASMYRVIAISDEDVRFFPVQGGVDGLYNTTSVTPTGGRK